MVVFGTRQSGGRKRPILVIMETKEAKDRVLDRAKHLKEAGDDYKMIYIKKDQHPSVRAEWRRLHDVEKAEKERPENRGCEIRLDRRERKIYRDGEVIDGWNLKFF